MPAAQDIDAQSSLHEEPSDDDGESVEINSLSSEFPEDSESTEPSLISIEDQIDEIQISEEILPGSTTDSLPGDEDEKRWSSGSESKKEGSVKPKPVNNFKRPSDKERDEFFNHHPVQNVDYVKGFGK